MYKFKTVICRFQRQNKPFSSGKSKEYLLSSTRQFKRWKLESSQRRNYALTSRSNNLKGTKPEQRSQYSDYWCMTLQTLSN